VSDGSSDASASPEPDRESPDPARIASPADFGRELTLARRRAGLAVRDLAAGARVPAGTLSGYLTGAHLPQLTYLDPFRRVLEVLGEGRPGADRVPAVGADLRDRRGRPRSRGR
jgi:hypothetical protein